MTRDLRGQRIMVVCVAFVACARGADDGEAPYPDADGDGVNAASDCDEADPDVGAELVLETGSDGLELNMAADLEELCPPAPGCRVVVDGSLTISPRYLEYEGSRPSPPSSSRAADWAETDIETLAPLACVVEVRGGLDLSALPVPNLEGLGSLSSVGSSLRLLALDELVTLEGLGSLSSVATLELSSLGKLVTLDGLSSITQVTGSLHVSYNDRLESLEGLESIEALDGNLDLDGNKSLTSLRALGGITSVGYYVRVMGSPSLESLTGLDALSFVGDSVVVADDGALVDLSGLGALTSIGADLLIQENEALASLDGLEALEFVGGDVMVCDNPALPEGAGEALYASIEAVEGSYSACR